MSHLATNYTIGQPFHEFQGVLCNFLAKNLVAVDKWEEYSNPSYSQQGEKQVFSTGIRKILEIFLDDRVGRGCVPSTVAWYRKEIGTFIEHITYNTYPDYGAAWLGYAKQQYEQYPNTAPTRLHALKAFYKFMEENGTIQCLPKMKIKSRKGMPKAIPTDLLIKVIEGLDKETRVLVLFLLDSGCRISEALNVRVQDIDMEGQLVHVRGKGGDPRTVTLGRYMEAGAHIFIAGKSYEDKIFKFGRKRYADRLAKACRLVGIPRKGFHALRHSFARNFLQKGGDIAELQKLLGHSQPTMSMHYAAAYCNSALKRQREVSIVDQLVYSKGLPTS